MQTKEFVIGCLTVVTGCANVGATCNMHGCNISAEAYADCKNKAVSVIADGQNGLDVLADNKNTAISIGIDACNVKIEVSAALVCYVGGDYELFYVTEGPLIVTDGYFMVNKEHGN